jgi:Divergent AAA domain.
MEFPKQIKDIVYKLLQEPTLDRFREFLKGQTGEHDTIDFKDQWIEKQKLAKEMISIANVGGGIIVFGIHENEDKSFSFDGVEKIKDKAIVSNEIKNFISTDLKYDIYDFVYDSSEYEKLNHHKYQMLVIEDSPKFLPFMSKRDSDDLKKNRIYVRRGTAIEEATQEEITKLIKRRIDVEYPDSEKTLELEEHLEQLETLYDKIKPTIGHYEGGMGGISESLADMLKQMTKSFNGKWVSEKNPLYPDES